MGLSRVDSCLCGSRASSKDAERGVSLLPQTYPELTAVKVRVAMVFPEPEMNWICGNLIAAGLPK
jgi:hypothetical protein